MNLAQKIILALAGLLCILLIGWLDYLTGEEIEFFVFYFLPVAFLAWFGGLWLGILAALLSAGDWLFIDLLTDIPESSWFIGTWDTLIRALCFVGLAILMARIHAALFEQQQLNRKLTAAMEEIKQLRGILPMCSFCRKIRDEQQNWIHLEKYIADHSAAQVSHGICPDCYRKHYGDPDGT